MKKTKYQEERKKYFLKKSLLFQILLSVSCIFLCIGYAKINDISLNIDGLSSAEKQKGIFISNVDILHNDNEINTSEILNSHGTMLNTNVVLDKKKDSEISFEITVHNNSKITQVYNKPSPTKYDEDFYNNKYITYEVDNRIVQGDMIEKYGTHKFTVTFKYVDDLDFDNLPEDFSNVLNAYINFDFKELQQITIGDNILDLSTKVVDTYINRDGTIIDYNGWSSSDYIDVSNYEYLIIVADSGSMLDNWNAAYDENYEFVKMLTINKVQVKNSELGNLYLGLNILKVEDSFKYIRISASTSVLNGVKIYPVLNDDFNMVLDYNILSFQVLFGDNIYNPSDNKLNTYINSSNGLLVGYNGWQSSDYIDLSGHKRIAIASESGTLLSNWNAFYDSDNNFIKNLNGASYSKAYNKDIGYYILVDVPSGANYLRMSEKDSVMKNLKVYSIIEYDYTKNEAQNLKIGDNFYNIQNNTINSYISKSGEEIAYDGWSSSEYIYIGDYDDWIIVGDSGASYEWNAYYDTNKSFISSFNCFDTKLYNKVLGYQYASLCIINRKENIEYIRISSSNSAMKNIRIYPILNDDYNGVLSFKIIKE